MAFDEPETHLSHQRWLVGGRFTEADLRLFATLVRFDTVYYVLFKCNLRRFGERMDALKNSRSSGAIRCSTRRANSSRSVPCARVI